MKKSNVIWNTFGSVFYSACQWIITIIVVHIANFETAGHLSLAMTMSSSFSAISLFSMRNYQISDVQNEFSTNQYVSSRIWTCMLSFIGCVIVAPFGHSIFQAFCIISFMLIRVAEAIVDVMHGINQKYDKYDYIGLSFIYRGIVTVVVFTLCLFISKNLLLTLFVMAILNLLVAILFDCRKTYGLEKYQLILKEAGIWSLLKKCFPLVIFTFLLSLENFIPKNVLENVNGATELGIYSTIASPTLVVQVFASVVFSPFMPIFSKTYYEGKYDEFRKMLHKTYLLLVALCVVVTIGAMLLGKIGLTILFGKDILENYYLFMPIVYCTLFTGICWILSAIVILLRKIKELLLAIIVDFILCIAITYPVINEFGKNGVSIVQLISLPILIISMMLICEFTSKRALNEAKDV